MLLTVPCDEAFFRPNGFDRDSPSRTPATSSVISEDQAGCLTLFRTCLLLSAHVAQGIERRFPKPCVAGSNPAGGTQLDQTGGGKQTDQRSDLG